MIGAMLGIATLLVVVVALAGEEHIVDYGRLRSSRARFAA
jgi:hypothetical protein